MHLESGQRVGAYEILGLLGSGGMGDVYRARDTRLGRLVALKLVTGDIAADPVSSERLVREARLASSLNHPNIVTVHDVGEADGRPFLVMELVEGQSLHELLETERLSLARATDLASQIADGLASAHDAGIIHRDLKPRNIMLTGDGRPKIVDFGIGKTGTRTSGPDDPTRQAEGLTGPRTVLGTAGYMAPEQVTQRPLDVRADQFALGAILYEMLTGQRAFKREKPVQTMAAIVEQEPAPLGELVPEAPEGLVRIVERCLAKDPGQRYASTRDLARDLRDMRQVLTGGTHSSRSTTTRRFRWEPLAAVAAIAVLAIAAVWTTMSGTSRLDEPRALLARYDKAAQIDRAVGLLQSAAATTPNSAETQALLAEALWRQYEHTRDASLIDRASAAASAALRLDDRYAPTHVVLAMINYGQGRYDGALGEAKRALELDGRSSAAWRELGRAHQGLRQLDEAEKAFVRAVEFGPLDWSVHNQLGGLRLSMGRAEDALPLLERARDLAPDNTRVYNNLGSVSLRLERLSDAAQMYERSLSIERNATAYSNLGTVYYSQAQYSDAARAYEGAVAMPGATFDHWRNLAAACYWAPGLRARAKEAYERAVDMGEAARGVNPRDPGVLTALASSYSVLSLFRDDPAAPTRAAAARALADGFERVPPQRGEHLFVVASVWEALGDRSRAFSWLIRAVAAGHPPKSIERSPWLEDLRKDQRYAELMKKR